MYTLYIRITYTLYSIQYTHIILLCSCKHIYNIRIDKFYMDSGHFAIGLHIISARMTHTYIFPYNYMHIAHT